MINIKKAEALEILKNKQAGAQYFTNCDGVVYFNVLGDFLRIFNKGRWQTLGSKKLVKAMGLLSLDNLSKHAKTLSDLTVVDAVNKRIGLGVPTLNYDTLLEYRNGMVEFGWRNLVGYNGDKFICTTDEFRECVNELAAAAWMNDGEPQDYAAYKKFWEDSAPERAKDKAMDKGVLMVSFTDEAEVYGKTMTFKPIGELSIKECDFGINDEIEQGQKAFDNALYGNVSGELTFECQVNSGIMLDLIRELDIEAQAERLYMLHSKEYGECITGHRGKITPWCEIADSGKDVYINMIKAGVTFKDDGNE